MLIYQSETVKVFDTESEAQADVSPMPVWFNPHAQLYAVAPSLDSLPFPGPWIAHQPARRYRTPQDAISGVFPDGVGWLHGWKSNAAQSNTGAHNMQEKSTSELIHELNALRLRASYFRELARFHKLNGELPKGRRIAPKAADIERLTIEDLERLESVNAELEREGSALR